MLRALMLLSLALAPACAPSVYVVKKPDGFSTGEEVPRDRNGEPILSAIRPPVDLSLPQRRSTRR